MNEKFYVYLYAIMGLVFFGIFSYLSSDELSNPLLFSPIKIDYYANLTLKDKIYFDENYIYYVNLDGKYRMLYRYWKEPLFFNKEIRLEKGVFLENVSSNWKKYYVKDYERNVYTNSNDDQDYKLIRILAQKNEVGLINSNYFKKGIYNLKLNYIIVPNLKYDDKFGLFDFILADNHLPYKKVVLRIKDPDHRIIKLIPEFLAKVEKHGDEYVLISDSLKDEMIRVKILLNRSKTVYGIKENVKELDYSTNLIYSSNFFYYLKIILEWIAKLILLSILIFSILSVVLYYKYGTEKEFNVPEMLSYLPKQRKPWLVNMIFHGNSMYGDVNGFNATLLDLYRRKIIDIIPYERKLFPFGKRKEVKIKILQQNPSDLDEYEKNVFNFIKTFSENGVFDTANLTKKKRDTNYFLFSHEFKKLLRYENKAILNKFIENKFVSYGIIFGVTSLLTMIITHLLRFIMIGFKPILAGVSYNSLGLFLYVMISLVVIPYQVYGRWKKDYYKEKLEWDAFAKFLKSLVTIQNKKIYDVSIWKDWLIYGTALGCGKEVEKALKQLNANFDELRIYSGLTPVFIRISREQSSHSSISGGGGGFGGGGAGAR